MTVHRYITLVLIMAGLAACRMQGQPKDVEHNNNMMKNKYLYPIKEIYFAGGCFWGTA